MQNRYPQTYIGQEGHSRAPDGDPIFYSRVELRPDEDPSYLWFARPKNGIEVPDRINKLRREYEDMAAKITDIFADIPELKVGSLKQLAAGAEANICGPCPSLKNISENLRDFKQIVLSRAKGARDHRLNDYTRLSLIRVFIPCIILGISMYVAAYILKPDLLRDPVFGWAISLFLIPAGSSLCVWLEFALRTSGSLSLDSLRNLDPGRWQPHHRILITVVTAFVFALVLGGGIVQIGLGPVLLNDFAKGQPLLSLAIGGITGLAFPYVSEILFRLRPRASASKDDVGETDG
jgi:hypothetical protein